MPANTNIFEPANKAIVDDIKKELRLQGHRFSGALESSLRERQVAENGGVTLTAPALGYLEDLEHGIDGGLIDFNKINFTFLATWVRVKSIWRGCSPKVALKIAFAIAKKWKREGFELEGAKFFSETGKVDEAVSETFEKNQPKFIGLVDEAAIGSLDNIFHEVKGGTI